MPYYEDEQAAIDTPEQGRIRRILADPVNELVAASVLTFGGGLALGQLSDRYDLSILAALTLLFIALAIMGFWLHAAYRTFRHYLL